jgi:hypothetical protein
LAFAIGLYLPLATTLPIFIGGAIKGFVDYRSEKKNQKKEEDELGKGSLFATGLIAGGALTGVFAAILMVADENLMQSLSFEHELVDALGKGGYALLSVFIFVAMCVYLYRTATKSDS